MMPLHGAVQEAVELNLFPGAQVDTAHASSVSSALERLRQHPFDAVLFNPRCSTSTPAEALRTLVQRAPGVPVIAVLDEHDRTLGPQLIRDGAQDFLFRNAIDCEPLAHSIRAAIERNRWPATRFATASLSR